jgi:hypothetical protein
MLRLKRWLLVAACLPTLAIAQVPAAYQGVPLHAGAWSHLTINDHGQVGGTVDNGRPAVWNRDGSFMLLPGDVTGAVLFAINNSGTIVATGNAPWYPNGRVQPLVWQAGGDAARVPVAGTSGEAKGLNSRGDIVGNVGDVFMPGGWFGFIRHDSDTLYFDEFHPVAINDTGEVVGSGPHGIRRWRNGVLSDVEPTPGAWALALNDEGWIAGAILQENEWFAAVWVPGQAVTSFGRGLALDLNDQGMVVGSSNGLAMLWYEGVGYRLDDLWAQEQPGEWTLISAEAINERGDIAALARNTRNGDGMTVLLLPVPEPSRGALLLAGLALLGGLRVRSGRRSA